MVTVDVSSETITYDEAKELARHDDPAVRAALARRGDLKPEILYFLAEDPNSEVRREVARNARAPRQTDLLLARDSDTEVRSDLAGKVAQVAPGLSAVEQGKARKSAHEALVVLAKDQMTVVRQILADTLKDVADAPTDVINTLARDVEIGVSGPVLESSPVLTDADLVEIIEHGTASGGLNAISRRDGLESTVTDAIVATNDVDAIAEMLSNDSAQIREATLDDLVNKAESVELWHAPLTKRPKLPPSAAGRMAKFLAENLLEALQARTDLGEDTMAAVRSAVSERLEADPVTLEDAESLPSATQDFLTMDLPMSMVERLYNARKLDSQMVAKALQASDHGFVMAAMVVKSGLDPNVCRRMFIEKSGKAITALCWKANLPPKLAVQIQQRMARIAPSEVVMPDDAGDFPMSEDDMEWQLEFFAEMAAKGGG